ncbi:MAG: ASCH domain-containing protein [Chloroflexota bacterium]|nr:ASCH domain-containing protein [Chloroflexota bacterium]
MEKSTDIQVFWKTFLNSLPADQRPAGMPEAWHFGDNPALADELLDLVMDGVKTATCGSLWQYEAEGEKIPEPGELSIILDGAGTPACVVETTEVEIKPYEQVDAGFAFNEGEGDRSLAYWRAVHWRFFSRTLPKIGRQPVETMPLVCERFRVVFPRQ